MDTKHSVSYHIDICLSYWVEEKTLEITMEYRLTAIKIETSFFKEVSIR